VERRHLEHPDRPQRTVTLRLQLRVLHVPPIGAIRKPYRDINVTSEDGVHAIRLQVVNELESHVRQQPAVFTSQLIPVPRTCQADLGFGTVRR
jgi:hypothetical protein